MDLQLLINDFFNDISIFELVKKYNIKYPRLCGIIKQYCIQNNIDFSDEIKKKLELPMDEIYNQRKDRTPYTEMSKKYGCSATMIKKSLDEYCKLNNLKTPDIERSDNLSVEEIYEKKKNGQTLASIGKEYQYSPTFIGKKILNYCEQEGLNYSEQRASVEEMYELRKKGKSYKQIGVECGYNENTVSKYIETYCAEKGLEVPKYICSTMPIEEIYAKKVTGSSYNSLAKEYGYNKSTLKKYLVQYCIENEIDPLILKGKLPMNEIFDSRKENISYAELSSQYGCSCGFLNDQMINYCMDSISQLNKMLEKEYIIKFLLDLKQVITNTQNNNLENDDIVYVNKK